MVIRKSILLARWYANMMYSSAKFFIENAFKDSFSGLEDQELQKSMIARESKSNGVEDRITHIMMKLSNGIACKYLPLYQQGTGVSPSSITTSHFYPNLINSKLYQA
jgi:hypothetical protein